MEMQTIFVHDLQAEETTRVSVSSDGVQANNHSSATAAISDDGRYIAFYSSASNLVSNDNNGYQDIFVHDRQTGQTTRVSVDTNGVEGNGNSVNPSISGDGRFVTFQSFADNLVSNDTNGYQDIFVHDRQTGETTRISVASDGTEGNRESVWPSISGDGRYVAFESPANNLVSDDTLLINDIFVHDRQTGETTCVSVSSNGVKGNAYSSLPSISNNGRHVAFLSAASNLVSDDTHYYAPDVFVHDRQTGETIRASIGLDGTEANEISGQSGISISSDGQYITFDSIASNLVNDDTNGWSDIFVYDRTVTMIPAAITDLQASPGVAAGELSLTWTAPENITADMSYLIKYADSPIINELGWASATIVSESPTPDVGGSPQNMVVKNLTPGQTYYFAIRVEYNNGNLSPLSNSPSAIPPDAKIIDLTISLYRTVDTQDRVAYEEIFGYFADAIYEMSNGVHKIGTITIYQNGASRETADIQWNENEWPRSQNAGYGKLGRYMLMGDEYTEGDITNNALAEENWQAMGYALAHEWGHYYYGLYDEYPESPCGILCSLDIRHPRPGDTPIHHSVMNDQAKALNGDFNWLNFSVAKNITGDTVQQRVYAVSGWETLTRPPSEDPRSLWHIAIPLRSYYPELASVAPGFNEDSSLELTTTLTETTRTELNPIWVDSVMRINLSQNSSIYWATVSSLPKLEVIYPKPVLLVASVAKSDPIAQATIIASAVDPNGDSLPLSLQDNGIPPDVLANDGFYTGYLPYHQSGTYTVTTTFDNHEGNAFFTQLGFNPSRGLNGGTFTPSFDPVGVNFTATATSTIKILGVQTDDHGDTPETATLAVADNVDVPGRIDRAGDADIFKVIPADTGWLSIRVSNLGLGMEPQIRLLATNGTTVLGDFTVTPTATSYFFTWLEATAGQPFYIEITHVDSNAVEGYYDVSVGQPLSNEHNDLYLPLVIRP